jgi:hypothetical protein
MFWLSFCRLSFFLDLRAAGRGRMLCEAGRSSIFVSRASFGEGPGRFLPMPPWGRLRGRQYYKGRRWAGGRGCLGVRILNPKIPPLEAKGWATKSNPSHPSRRRRRVGHPQNLKLNSGMELLAVDLPSVVILKMQERRVGHPSCCDAVAMSLPYSSTGRSNRDEEKTVFKELVPTLACLNSSKAGRSAFWSSVVRYNRSW